jgi:hypothetical protein
MTAQPSPQFDFSPVMKIYVESVDLWKKNYEAFIKSANDMRAATSAEGIDEKAGEAASYAKSFASSALVNWQKTGGDVFKGFVQNQIEICRFFGHRWEQYLALPDQFSQCRTVTELGNAQAAFLKQFARDYMHETGRLAQPVTEAMSNWSVTKQN